MKTTYDAKVYDLAMHFLTDVDMHHLSPEMLKHHADMLAQDIQRLVENYLEEIAQ